MTFLQWLWGFFSLGKTKKSQKAKVVNPNSNRRIKEKVVVDYLVSHFKHYQLVCNKAAGNSRLRPDVRIELASHTVIVEIDEHQHCDYSDEKERMRDIKAALKCKKIVFIRFNPDIYTDGQGVKHQSCWQAEADSQQLHISNKSEWKRRLTALNHCLSDQLTTLPTRSLTVIYLYYDGYLAV